MSHFWFVMRWLHILAMAGGPPTSAIVAHGVDLAVAEINLRYLAPARFDDVLEITVTVRDIGTTAVTVGVDARVTGEPVVRAETRYVCVGTATGTKEPAPNAVRRALANYMDEPAGRHLC
jgi:acyl-CoA thioesterase FadM